MKKRLLMCLTVVAMMVAMLAMSVAPAFAARPFPPGQFPGNPSPPDNYYGTACTSSGGNAFGGCSPGQFPQ